MELPWKPLPLLLIRLLPSLLLRSNQRRRLRLKHRCKRPNH